MYNVSSDYKAQINKSTRNISYIKVNIGIVDPDAKELNTMTDNGSLFFSDVVDTDLGQNVEKRYLTMEHNRFILDGKNLIPPESGGGIPYYQGFVSNSMSDSAGVFATPPKITISFPSLFSFIGLTFKFDDVLNSYPTELQLIAYNGVTVVYNRTVYPTSFDFVLQDLIPTTGLFCNKIEVIFKKSFPVRRRANLSYIMFGVVKSFDDKDISSSTLLNEIDLLSSKLPKNEFEFKVIDLAMEYNPENPTGIWQYLEARQPVWFEYGYELDNGTIEWINGGNLYTTGELNTESNNSVSIVSFKTSSILSQLDMTYYKGTYYPAGISLYNLALDVLNFANLPLLKTGGVAWNLDNALTTIFTTAPIPEILVREALQLIANAGRCVLSIDREGRICILRNSEVATTFAFDFSNIVSPPLLSKTPYLLSVDTFSHTMSVDSTVTTVHTSDVNLSVATQCIFKYEPTTNASLVVGTGATLIGQPVYYAGSCVATISGAGKITISGNMLRVIKDSLSVVVGTSGSICPIENVLLTNPTDALAYANWVASMLVRRNQYEITDRGYPELDTGDVILADTLFTTAMESTIISSKIEYNGSLRSTTKYLSKEVV